VAMGPGIQETSVDQGSVSNVSAEIAVADQVIETLSPNVQEISVGEDVVGESPSDVSDEARPTSQNTLVEIACDNIHRTGVRHQGICRYVNLYTKMNQRWSIALISCIECFLVAGGQSINCESIMHNLISLKPLLLSTSQAPLTM
jgi:hypothetical protein